MIKQNLKGLTFYIFHGIITLFNKRVYALNCRHIFIYKVYRFHCVTPIYLLLTKSTKLQWVLFVSIGLIPWNEVEMVGTTKIILEFKKISKHVAQVSLLLFLGNGIACLCKISQWNASPSILNGTSHQNQNGLKHSSKRDGTNWSMIPEATRSID